MTISTQTLSLAMAKKMADAAENLANQKQLKIVIAIMDQHGNLKYYRRMDNNNFVSVRMAQLKAFTSASIAISTKDLADRNEQLPNLAYLGVPGIVLLEGGLPIITKNGEHICAIGISGANPELDGLCAQAALDAIFDELLLLIYSNNSLAVYFANNYDYNDVTELTGIEYPQMPT